MNTIHVVRGDNTIKSEEMGGARDMLDHSSHLLASLNDVCFIPSMAYFSRSSLKKDNRIPVEIGTKSYLPAILLNNSENINLVVCTDKTYFSLIILISYTIIACNPLCLSAL